MIPIRNFNPLLPNPTTNFLTYLFRLTYKCGKPQASETLKTLTKLTHGVSMSPVKIVPCVFRRGPQSRMDNFMFKVGDNAVYPAHGVGVIKRIEKKLISGKEKSFYVLQVLENGMTIMVPTDNTAGVGLRALVSKQEVDEVMGILRDKKVKIDRTTWNRRYREYMEKIKTGSVKEIAEVLRNLYLLKNSKDLSFGEKKMFDTAKNLLVKEISMSNRIPEAEVEAELTKALGSA